jgi:UDP-glucose 4-epimerase
MSSISNKKIVVTGGAGFIGSHIVDALVASGARVTVIDDLSTGKEANLAAVADNIEFIQGSINDMDLLKRTFNGAYAVFHEAAIASVPQSIAFPEETRSVNVGGTLNVFKAAQEAGVDRVIYATSSAVYGDDPVMPKNETIKTCPISPYGEHKLQNEIDAHGIFASKGLKTIGLRYFNVFGPRQNPFSEYSAVIPKFIALMKKGTAPSIYGDGLQTRDFIYVADVVAANLAALEAENGFGEVFNVATGGRISLNDLVDKINGILKSSFQASHLPVKQGDIKDSYADVSKAAGVLGFRAKTTFEDGLAATVRSLEVR